MKILFVYNANKDPVSALVGYVHKVFRPSTYPCELCALTYHNFGERSEWKDFRKERGENVEFRYIREFENTFSLRPEYPVVLSQEGEELSIVMSREQIQSCKDVTELIERIKMALKNEG